MKDNSREDRVSFSLAKRLKNQHEFDWEVSAIYSPITQKLYTQLPYENYNHEDKKVYLGEIGENKEGSTVISAPTLAQVQAWLKQNEYIDVVAIPNPRDFYGIQRYFYKIFTGDDQVDSSSRPEYITYSQALEEGLEQVL